MGVGRGRNGVQARGEREERVTARHIYRYPNGGAQCSGFDHDFSADCFLDHQTLIEGRTVLTKTFSRCSFLKDVIAIDSRLVFAQLRDCIVRRANVVQVQLVGVVVTDAQLLGPWKLEGLAQIHGGTWSRPPMFKEIEGGNGLHVGLTECHLSGRVHFSSRCHEAAQWMRSGPRLGRKLGWTEAQIKEAYSFCEAVLESQRKAVA